MSVTPSSAIVGVFTDRAIAEQALDALYNAGITHDQVRYSGTATSGSFLDDLKSLFTGQNAGGNVANDLTDLGLSNEEANYYVNEHNKGNAIVAVKAPGREAEVQSILQQHGSLNARSQTISAEQSVNTQPTMQQPITTSNGDIDTRPSIHQPVTTNYNDEVQHSEPSITTYDSTEQHDAPLSAVQNTPPITHDNVTESAHSEVNNQMESQQAQPVVLDGSLQQDTSATTSSYDTTTIGGDDTNTSPSHTDREQQAQSFSQDVGSTTPESVATDSYATPDTLSTTTEQTASGTQPTTTEYAATDPHATSDAMIESETASQTTNEAVQTAPESYTQESEDAGIPDIQTAQPVATTSDYSSESQLSDAQAATFNVPTQPLTTNSKPVHESTTTTSDAQSSVTGMSSTTTNDTDELQSLQAQIASLQQQLQGAKAQLQAAKEREEQTRAAREREQQLQSLRQQLQALQAELAATHSEIQETQSRIGGY